ncbi:MAG: hypothetical protein QOF99_1675 [Pseudonocardiales bacterium]|nr:hypothetical protein [Pseudonocardiales bacterium]
MNCCTCSDLFGVIRELWGTPELQILPVGRWGADQTDAKPGPVVSGDDPGPACLHLTPGRRPSDRNHWRTRWGTVRSVLVTIGGPPPSHGRVRPAQWDNEDVRRHPRLRPSPVPNRRARPVLPAEPIDLSPDLAQFGLTRQGGLVPTPARPLSPRPTSVRYFSRTIQPQVDLGAADRAPRSRACIIQDPPRGTRGVRRSL